MTDPRRTGSIIPLDELEHTAHSHELVGAEHGAVPFSIILVETERMTSGRTETVPSATLSAPPSP